MSSIPCGHSVDVSCLSGVFEAPKAAGRLRAQVRKGEDLAGPQRGQRDFSRQLTPKHPQGSCAVLAASRGHDINDSLLQKHGGAVCNIVLSCSQQEFVNTELWAVRRLWTQLFNISQRMLHVVVFMGYSVQV